MNKILFDGKLIDKPDYLPRFVRIGAGVYDVQKNSPAMREREQRVPILDEDGVLLREDIVKVAVVASDDMQQYPSELFRLENQLANGVNLKKVEIDVPVVSGDVGVAKQKVNDFVDYLNRDSLFDANSDSSVKNVEQSVENN